VTADLGRGVFGRVADSSVLTPVERDPVTGKLLDAGRARRNKRNEQRGRAPAKRSRVLVGAAAVAAVLVVGGIAVAATAGGSKAKAKASTPSGANPGGGTVAPGGAVVGTVPGGLTALGAVYPDGITTLRSHVTGGYSDNALKNLYLRLDCNPNGCAMELGPFGVVGRNPLSRRAAANGWSLQTKAHSPDGILYQCIPSDPGDFGIDLHGVGTKQFQNVVVPARITGTITAKAPQTKNCPGIDSEFAVDAAVRDPSAGLVGAPGS